MQFNYYNVLEKFYTGEIPPTWHVFHISKIKLTLVIVGLCFSISFCMGFLALYLLENFDHHPPVPPSAIHAILIIISLFVIGAVLLSIITWSNMRNIVLIITPEGLIRGNYRKPKKVFYIAYQEITEMYIDGSSVFLKKRSTSEKKLIDCRLFEASTQQITSSLLAAYQTFGTKRIYDK